MRRAEESTEKARGRSEFDDDGIDAIETRARHYAGVNLAHRSQPDRALFAQGDPRACELLRKDELESGRHDALDKSLPIASCQRFP